MGHMGRAWLQNLHPGGRARADASGTPGGREGSGSLNDCRYDHFQSSFRHRNQSTWKHCPRLTPQLSPTALQESRKKIITGIRR